MRLLLKYSLLSLLFCSAMSCAGIKVSPLVLRFQPTNTYQDLLVRNVGETTQYVNIIPKLIILRNNKTRQIVIKNPKKLGLLITPSKLVLMPNQSKYVRIVLTKLAGKVERDYIIAVTPVTGQLVFPEIKGNKAKDGAIAMKVIIAYGVMALVNPKNARMNFVLHRNGKKITAKNNGNVTLVLRDAKQCDKKRGKCFLLTKIPTKILYPNQSWSFIAPREQSVSFDVTYAAHIAKKMKYVSN